MEFLRTSVRSVTPRPGTPARGNDEPRHHDDRDDGGADHHDGIHGQAEDTEVHRASDQGAGRRRGGVAVTAAARATLLPACAKTGVTMSIARMIQVVIIRVALRARTE